MKYLSRFDIGVIIAFVVIGLLGGGASWYLSSELGDAQGDASAAKANFDKYSTNHGILVSVGNKKVLQDNIDLITAQLNPVIQTQFQSKNNKLSSIGRRDPVAWKHDLDEQVRLLNDAARHRSFRLPGNFYFAFSRYLNNNPGDEQTLVLSKQFLMVGQIATTLINAPVQSIDSIRRTYEEDDHHPPGVPGAFPASTQDPDRLMGYAYGVGGGLYTDYPYEIVFDSTVEGFRKVMSDLMQSPYTFVIRSITVENTVPNSPTIDDLTRMAGPATPSITETAPGTVAAAASTKGTQFLFSNSPLHITARVDLVEWNGGNR